MAYADAGPCARCKKRDRPSKNAPYCRPCSAEYAREKRALKKAKREYTGSPSQLAREYGCTVDEYRERMNSADACQVCGSTHRLQYDHDHDTMAFRGVLCWECNVGIGKLGDGMEGVIRALEYLRRHYETS